MALPNPGNSISLSQINTELTRSSTAQISLNTAEDNGYVTINGCSQYRPRPNNPATLSEWYRYNHSATCNVCYNGSNALTGSFSTTQSNPFVVTYPISFQNVVGESVLTLITTNVSAGVNVSAGYALFYTGGSGFYSTVSFEAGAINTTNTTNGTFTSYSYGAYTTNYTGTDGLDYLYLQIYPYSGQGTVTGNYELRFSCPTITACGNTLNTAVANCQYTDWHWLDAGTSSRNITLTYSLASGFNATPKLTIKDENNNTIVNAVTVSAGTNQTYTFSFTYNGYRYIKILFYDDYSC